MEKVALVTGVSGFLGGHVALQLLASGYRVRGTVRDPAKADKVTATLRRAGADTSGLEFATLDLLADDGWAEAATGCDAVIHTASPFVTTMPRNPDDLIRPAVEGTRRAVEAALAANVRRVVLTSSIAAIVYGHPRAKRTFDERDWTDLGAPDTTAYRSSKTLAEAEAWALMDAAGRRGDLAVINPGTILGPLLDDDPGTSGAIIAQMIRGRVPAAPRMTLEWVDVRDVAAAHVAAIDGPDAGGNRHIVSGDALSLMEIAGIISETLPVYRRKLPKFQMPDWLTRLAARFDPALKDAEAELGPSKRTDKRAAERLLGRALITARDAVAATARSAVANGIA